MDKPKRVWVSFVTTGAGVVRKSPFPQEALDLYKTTQDEYLRRDVVLLVANKWASDCRSKVLLANSSAANRGIGEILDAELEKE